jgi:hypothetical protein
MSGRFGGTVFRLLGGQQGQVALDSRAQLGILVAQGRQRLW